MTDLEMEGIKYTRAQYLDGECTFREYYAQFVSSQTKALVLAGVGLKALLASKDPHLNDIPLQLWDRMHPLAARKVGKANGLGGVSLSESVCVAKEAARQIIEENQS